MTLGTVGLAATSFGIAGATHGCSDFHVDDPNDNYIAGAGTSNSPWTGACASVGGESDSSAIVHANARTRTHSTATPGLVVEPSSAVYVVGIGGAPGSLGPIGAEVGTVNGTKQEDGKVHTPVNVFSLGENGVTSSSGVNPDPQVDTDGFEIICNPGCTYGPGASVNVPQLTVHAYTESRHVSPGGRTCVLSDECG